MYTNYSYLNSMGVWFYLLLVADIILRGLSLWKSAKKNQTIWFVALMIVNTMGILPLIYLLIEKYNSSKAVTPAIKKVAAKKKASKK